MVPSWMILIHIPLECNVIGFQAFPKGMHLFQLLHSKSTKHPSMLWTILNQLKNRAVQKSSQMHLQVICVVPLDAFEDLIQHL